MMSAATDEIAEGKKTAAPKAAPRVGARRGWLGGFLRYALMLVVPLALLAGAGYWYLLGGRYVSTDDAYVQADMVSISADVSARVVEVAVHDNQKVTAGQLLFRLDDSTFRIARDRAKAQLASARLQVDSLRATYRQKLSDLKAAQDTLAYQQHELERQRALLASHVTPQSKFDEVRHDFDAAQQQVAAAQQQVASALANLGGNPDIPIDQHPQVQQAQAQLDQAELDLSHTVIHAPLNGIVTKVDRLPVGQYLTAATPAFSLLATDEIWVEANFKETDLTYLRPGQTATIDIDTYPDHSFTGRVESIGAGTGSEFSVLPPQNATGNWVKVVQRIPVRLAIVDRDAARPLSAGMSVTADVDTRHRHELLIKIDALLGRSRGIDRAEAATPK
jgi:membrane fusion protein, multidrug efflux system